MIVYFDCCIDMQKWIFKFILINKHYGDKYFEMLPSLTRRKKYMTVANCNTFKSCSILSLFERSNKWIHTKK